MIPICAKLTLVHEPDLFGEKLDLTVVVLKACVGGARRA